MGRVTQALVLLDGQGGSRNASWRRESPGGDTEEPEADTFRVPWKQGREKLNDERGESPCQ